MEEQGKGERVMDNADSHLAMHIPHIKTIHTTTHSMLINATILNGTNSSSF